MQQQQLTPQQKAQLRLSQMLIALDYEKVMLQFDLPEGPKKIAFDAFNGDLQVLIAILTAKMPPAGKKYLEDMGVVIWEVFDQLDKAPNKIEFLAMCKAYNAGEMRIENPEAA